MMEFLYGGLITGAITMLVVWLATRSEKPKKKPIESNILVDPKMVPELMHRWNCYQDMLEALIACLALVCEDNRKHLRPEWEPLEKQVTQAIAKAERKE